MIGRSSYEEIFETENGSILVQSSVLRRGDELILNDFTLYPTSGTRMTLRVGDGVAIFHAIMEEARELGFQSCSIIAVRTGGAKPGRIL